jgi:hypothetical protein
MESATINANNFSQGSRSQGRNLNLGLPKEEAELLFTGPRRSDSIFFVFTVLYNGPYIINDKAFLLIP